MRKLRIYLDTSVINFLFADDAPEKRDMTRQFFDDHVARRRYEIWISDVVLREQRRTRDAKHRSKLMGVVSQYDLRSLPMQPEDALLTLAEAYVREGAIPLRKYDDALHLEVMSRE